MGLFHNIFCISTGVCMVKTTAIMLWAPTRITGGYSMMLYMTRLYQIKVMISTIVGAFSISNTNNRFHSDVQSCRLDNCSALEGGR